MAKLSVLLISVLLLIFFPGRDGLVHISQITDERVENVGDYLRVGDNVRVRVLDIDNTGRIRLSIKALTDEAASQPQLLLPMTVIVL